MKARYFIALACVALALSACSRGSDAEPIATPEASQDFLSDRDRFEADRAAQYSLRNGQLALKAFWTDNGTFLATPAHLQFYMPTLEISQDPEAVGNGAPIYLAEQGQVLLYAVTEFGRAFCVAESDTTGTRYGQAPELGDINTFDACWQLGSGQGWS